MTLNRTWIEIDGREAEILVNALSKREFEGCEELRWASSHGISASQLELELDGVRQLLQKIHAAAETTE